MTQRNISLFKRLDFSGLYKPARIKPAAHIEWALLLLGALTAFFIFMYMDFPNTIDNSVLLVKAVCSGHFLDFYEYTIENAATNYAANYEILAYIPFAVWNLPIAVLSMATGLDYLHSVPALLWSKTALVVIAAIGLYFFYRIQRQLRFSRETAVLGCYLTASSVTAFWPLLIIAQIDVAAVALMLAGFYCYLKDRLLPFVLLFALAVPFKSFALLLFIPLLLLREKRFAYLFFSGVLVVGPLAVCKLLFSGSVMYQTALKTQAREGMESLFNYTDLLGAGKISLFVAAFIALCIFCYLHKPKSPQALQHTAVYCALLVWTALLAFSSLRSYWLIYAAPFTVLAILQNGRFLKVNLLLELIGSTAYVLYNFCGSGAVATDKNICWRLMLGVFVEMPEENALQYQTVHGLTEWLGIAQYRWLFLTVFVTAAIAVAVLSCPWLFRKTERDAVIERSVVLVRPLVLWGIIAVYLFAMTSTAVPPVADYLDTETAVSTGVDLYAVDRISQPFDVAEDGELQYVSFLVKNSLDNRRNFGHIDVIINDLTTGRELLRQTVGSAILEDGKITTLSFDKIAVSASDSYELVFEGTAGLDEELTKRSNTLELMRTETPVDPAHPAAIDGVTQDYQLAVRIS